MKNKPLNLKALKIDSFVTSLDLGNEETLKAKGGFMHTCPIPYPEFATTPCNCNTSHGLPAGCYQPR